MSRTLTLGHSPDPDDAFMFYALAREKIDTRNWRFQHELQDIQTLNDRAARGELDITAISIHAYPFVAERYALTRCGCSMGDGYGPIVVSRRAINVADLKGREIAVPGLKTTAFLVLNLLLGRESFVPRAVMFDRVLDAVAGGEVDAGLVIHEGQLTFGDRELHAVIDLGRWWRETTGLPLPLGGNCIRRDLGGDVIVEIARVLTESIAYSLAHRDEAVDYAMQFARGMDHRLADRFVGMYVNDWTLDYGPVGLQAVRELLSRGHEIGLVPRVDQIDLVG